MAFYFLRPSEPNFHPEFGFMYPSSTFRRLIRVAAMSIACGAAVGAIAVFAFAPRTDAARATAFNIVTVDEVAASPAPASSSTIGLEPPLAAVPKPAQAKQAAADELLAADDGGEPKASSKKRKKKVVQNRPRRRERDESDAPEGGLNR